MPAAPIPQPHSYEFLGMPWATREQRFHPGPSSPSPVAVPPAMRGQFAGTPAYDAGAAVPGGTLPLPAPYDWEGKTPVPNELYAMLVDLASAISGSGPPIPGQTDTSGVSDWMRFLYQALTTKGEGCGVDPDDLERIIIRHAPEGPHAVAYYIQEAALSSDVCAQSLFKRPLGPPDTAVPNRGNPAPHAPDPGSHETPSGGTLVTNTPKTGKKPFPWGWTIGGVSAALAVAVGVYFLYKGNKKRKNPCKCNPTMALAIESDDEEERENPYAGTNAYSSIDGQVLGQTLDPLLRQKNPKARRRRRRR